MSANQTVILSTADRLKKIAGKLTLMICGAAALVIAVKSSDKWTEYKLDQQELASIRRMDKTCDDNREMYERLLKISPSIGDDKPIMWHCKARWYMQEERELNRDSKL